MADLDKALTDIVDPTPAKRTVSVAPPPPPPPVPAKGIVGVGEEEGRTNLASPVDTGIADAPAENVAPPTSVAPVASVPPVAAAVVQPPVGKPLETAAAASRELPRVRSSPGVATPSGLAAEPSRAFGLELAVSLAERLDRARIDADVNQRRFNVTRLISLGLESLPTDVAALLVEHQSVLNLTTRLRDDNYVPTKRVTIRLTTSADQNMAHRIKAHYDATGHKVGRNHLIAIVLDRALP